MINIPIIIPHSEKKEFHNNHYGDNRNFGLLYQFVQICVVFPIQTVKDIKPNEVYCKERLIEEQQFVFELKIKTSHIHAPLHGENLYIEAVEQNKGAFSEVVKKIVERYEKENNITNATYYLDKKELKEKEIFGYY